MSNALYIILNVVYATSRDMDNVGFTNRYISASANTQAQILRSGASWRNMGVENPTLTDNFSVLKKCRNKFERLVHEVSFIQERKPPLNVQSDSILAKLF